MRSHKYNSENLGYYEEDDKQIMPPPNKNKKQNPHYLYFVGGKEINLYSQTIIHNRLHPHIAD